MISPGFDAPAFHLHDHQSQFRVHQQEVDLPVPVRLGIQQVRPHEDVRFGRQGPEGVQDLLFAVVIWRDAWGIGVEGGHDGSAVRGSPGRTDLNGYSEAPEIWPWYWWLKPKCILTQEATPGRLGTLWEMPLWWPQVAVFPKYM